MSHTIAEIKANLKYGGWRPSHFDVIITNPFAPSTDQDITIMVRAASIPAYNIGKIPVPYFGRNIYVAGDRQWDDWNTTIMNDEDFRIRDALELWSNQINRFEGNISGAGTNPNNYKSSAIVRAYSKAGGIMREYKINGIFPIAIAPIDTDWGTQDTIAEYQVTWSVDDVEVLEGLTGNSGGK